MKRHAQLIIIGFAVAAVLAACNNGVNSDKYEDTVIKMDTPMTITAYGYGAEDAVKEAFKRIDEIEQLTSLSISTSEVNRLNDAAGKDYVRLHPEVFELVKKSVQYSKLSGGAFDITIGPVAKLWNFGTDSARVPSADEIREGLSLVGYDKIKINEEDKSIMLSIEGMRIDLGGIAKGYAADEAAGVIRENRIDRAIINLGGSNVYVIGRKSEKQFWSIGIQNPRKGQGGGFLGIVRGADETISTSGDYERFFIEDGKRYHHILDPSTGYPAESGVVADSIVIDSSVVENSSMLGDALSTAVFVLGPDKGMKLIENINGIEGIITTSDNRLLASAGMKDKIESISKEFRYDAQGR